MNGKLPSGEFFGGVGFQGSGVARVRTEGASSGADGDIMEA